MSMFVIYLLVKVISRLIIIYIQNVIQFVVAYPEIECIEGAPTPGDAAEPPREYSHISNYIHPENGSTFSLLNSNLAMFKLNRCYVILLYYL